MTFLLDPQNGGKSAPYSKSWQCKPSLILIIKSNICKMKSEGVMFHAKLYACLRAKVLPVVPAKKLIAWQKKY